MSDNTPLSPQGPAGPKLSELADAAGVGVERRILLTLYDTLFRPGRAAQAAFDRAETHVSPLKIFVVVAGLFFSMAAFFGAPTTLTVDSLVPPQDLDAARAYIEAQNADPAAVNAALSTWGGVLVWPITLIASLVYIVVLKLVRPSVTWFGHVLIFLIATNAMTLLAIPLTAMRLVSLELFVYVQIGTILVFYLQMMRLGSSALKLGPGRLGLLFVLIVMATAPALLLSTVLQFATAWVIMDFQGVSILEMMDAGMAAAEAGAS